MAKYNEVIKYNDEKLIELSSKQYTDIRTGRWKWENLIKENHAFYNGNHMDYQAYAYGLPVNIGNISRVIQYSSVLIQNKRTQILTNDPVPVISRDLITKDPKNAEIIAMTLENRIQRVFDRNMMFVQSDDYVLNGCIDNASFYEVFTDDKKEIVINGLDWWDVLVDPTTYDLSGYHLKNVTMVGKMFNGTIGVYKNKDGYVNMDKIVPTDKYSKIEAKDSAQEQRSGAPLKSMIDDYNKFLGIEWQCQLEVNDELKEFVKSKSNLSEWGNEDYSWIETKKEHDTIMFIFTVAQHNVIRKVFASYSRPNIFVYVPQSGPMYNFSIFSRLISANKSYDSVISNIEKFMAFANKYRVILENGSLIQRLDNINGQEIYIKPGTAAPTVMQNPNISDSFIQYVAKLEGTMQFLVNFNQASLGQNITGQKKFKAQEGQKVQDLKNTQPEIHRLRGSYTELTKFVLELIADNQQIEDFSMFYGDDRLDLRIIGEGYKDYLENNLAPHQLAPFEIDKMVVIKKNFPVHVEIKEETDYSKDKMFDLITTLVKENLARPQAIKLIAEDGRILPYLLEAEKEDTSQNKQQPQQQNTGNSGSPGSAAGNLGNGNMSFMQLLQNPKAQALINSNPKLKQAVMMKMQAEGGQMNQQAQQVQQSQVPEFQDNGINPNGQGGAMMPLDDLNSELENLLGDNAK